MLKRFAAVFFFLTSVFSIYQVADAGQMTEEERAVLNRKVHDEEVAKATRAFEILTGKVHVDGSESDPDWVLEVKGLRVAGTSIVETCDDYERWRRGGVYLEDLFAGEYTSKVVPSEVPSVDSQKLHKQVEDVGLKAAGGFLVAMKNPSPDYICGYGEGSFSLTVFTAFDSLTEILKYLKKSPKDIKSSSQELRQLLLVAAKKEVDGLRDRLADSADAKGIVNSFIVDYNFTPQELGLSADQEILLKK